jgi:hypothetical protein
MKKIPDVVHNENVSMKRVTHTSPPQTRYMGPHKETPPVGSKQLIPEPGDKIWAYSGTNKAWFYSIVIKYKPEAGRVEVYNMNYGIYGYDETYPHYEDRKTDNTFMKFCANIYTTKRPEGITAPGFEDVILEDFT